jgi:hypothetical protein
MVGRVFRPSLFSGEGWKATNVPASGCPAVGGRRGLQIISLRRRILKKELPLQPPAPAGLPLPPLYFFGILQIYSLLSQPPNIKNSLRGNEADIPMIRFC